MSLYNLSRKDLVEELRVQMWQASNKLIWGIIFFMVLGSILDFLIVPAQYIELTVLKVIGLTIIVISHYLLAKVQQKPFVLLHVILLTLVFVNVYSLTLTPVNGKILYLVLLTVTFISFNTIAVWRVSDAAIQFLVFCLLIIVLSFFNMIDLDALLVLGGYTCLAICAVSTAFPAIKMLALKDRVEEDMLRKREVDDILKKKENCERELNHKTGQIKKFENEIKVLRHELKNRLGSIESLIELIELENRYLQEPGQHDYMQLIKSSIADVSGSTDSLFEVFTEDHLPQAAEITRTAVDLHELIKNNEYKFFESTSSKNIKLDINLRASHHIIQVDKNMADIAIYNLMKYAINFSRNNDTIIINTRQEQEAIFLEILNRNTGISMSTMEAHFKNINDYKLKEIQQTKGLGLSIAKNHIELLDGHLRYSSSVSLGFEFLVEFNLSQS
ncbi:MAG: hypothetical protein CL868_15615 [Cytophagaceae bacterium]|nr:hypothetical protein [Cytophagaceae bacterium]|tara:strand:- start:1565 stop:2899 length:1335 start_codon:yes stop_codon:yes gene_type:complete